MAAHVYTALIYEGHAVTTASGAAEAGVLTVIRNATIFYPGSSDTGQFQLIHVGTGATILYNTSTPDPTGSMNFLSDLRVVLEPGEEFLIECFGDPDVHLSGFKLKLP